MQAEYFDEIDLEVGGHVSPLVLIGAGGELLGIHFGRAADHPRFVGPAERDPDQLADAVEQLRQYGAGDRKEFDLPLKPVGTDFQLAVWARLAAIPFGQTTTYGAIGAEVGKGPAASRAVGAAVGSNPIAIIIPCHRVIGANGALTGFAGGLDNKRALLVREGVLAF